MFGLFEMRVILVADLLRWFCDRNLDRFNHRWVVNSSEIITYIPCEFIKVNKLVKENL